MFTIGDGKSCKFKKWNFYETKLYIHTIIDVNAIQTSYKKYKK